MTTSRISAQHDRGSATRNVAPLQRAALFAVHFYMAFLSMQLGGTCRFQPTCSQYAYDAVERFGALRGCWLALKRLLRCHPLSRKFGYDPVPETLSVCSARFLKRADFQAVTDAPEPSAKEAHS